MKKQTHAQRQKQRFAELSLQICKILKINGEQYNVLRFELAYEYQEQRGNGHDLMLSKTYWGWWIATVASCDSAFIIKYENGMYEGKPLEELRAKYKAMQISNPCHMPDGVIDAVFKEVEQYEQSPKTT